MASGEDVGMEESKEPSGSTGRIKTLRKRCLNILQGNRRKAKKWAPPTSPSETESGRSRRSRLAEDALFYDEMFEDSQLRVQEASGFRRRRVKDLVTRAFNTSPVTSCVCLRYEPNSESSRLNSMKRQTRELKQVEAKNERDSLELSSPIPVDAMMANQLDSMVLTTQDDPPRSSLLNFLHFDFSNVTASHQSKTPVVHSQMDFTNFLIPGQRDIVNCSFYWGKIDGYEAEELLADKPEGSFLLRDSAQDDFAFSVSFRRYSRSLHARIEEEDHLFSFDSHDPGVHCSYTIRQLLEHYKDPLSCMFFEPMLLFPVVRKTCFSLQNLARATICDHTTYAGITELPMPKVLKQYLREYHYKHKIRTRYLEASS